MDILRNTSSELKTLQEADAVTNITFEVRHISLDLAVQADADSYDYN